MAAITPKAGSPYSKRVVLRTGATTTLTDWLDVPDWCDAIKVHLRVTVAGTNTILTIREANPEARDDAAGTVIVVATSATVTATGYHTYLLHPACTTVADAAAANTAAQHAVAAPSLVGVTVTPTGSTYSTEIEFLKLGR